MKDYPPYLDYPKERKPQTNADRIRAMTDEELANMIGTHDCLDCPLDNEDDWCIGAGRSCTDKVLNWLKSPLKAEERRREERDDG